jgi:tRNA(fMet)-specific endonuclease VapC
LGGLILFLLDTNIASKLIDGRDMELRQRFYAALVSNCRVSVISEAELKHGIAKPNLPPALSVRVLRFLSKIKILPWTSREAEAYVELRLAMRRSGTSLTPFDALIAAQALASNAVLVTADKAFARIPRLSVENWAA